VAADNAGKADAPAAGSRGPLRRPTDDTLGTGSTLGIGCALVVVVAVLILAALFFLPYLR